MKHHILPRLISLILILVLVSSSSKAQTEYLVVINPKTGTFAKIDSIEGVNWIALFTYTTFDEVNQRYIFNGSYDRINFNLYSVDAHTAAVVSNPPYPVPRGAADNVIGLQYDNSSNTLYGLHWDESDGLEYFVSIEPATGSFTKINSIPPVKIVASICAFDENKQRYFFKGRDVGGSYYLYTIDAKTGNILHSPTYPVGVLNRLEFDNSSNTLYGLHWNSAEKKEYLVSVDPISGHFSILHHIPGLTGIRSTTFDEINQRYIIHGQEGDKREYLYSINVKTGEVVSKPVFPVLADPLDNVIELEFDNVNGILYALHWDANDDGEDKDVSFSVYPNPYNSSATVEFNWFFKEIVILMHSTTGQLVKRVSAQNAFTVELGSDNLASGAYLVTAICDNEEIGTKKVIIE